MSSAWIGVLGSAAAAFLITALMLWSLYCTTLKMDRPVVGKFLRSVRQKDIEAFYRMVVPAMRAAAREHGYALGVHGSMKPDLDLIAAPWTDIHSNHDTLLRAMQRAACGIENLHYAHPGPVKPCGRRAYVFAIGMKAYVDVSVMPRIGLAVDGSTYYPFASAEAFIAALQEKNK